MAKNNNNKEIEPEVKQADLEAFGTETKISIPDKAFLILDSAVEQIEKTLNKQKTKQIVDKAKKSTKISKPVVKLSEPETETPLKDTDMEIIPSTDLKEQYVEGISAVLILINPFLILKGIEPIKDNEIRDLVYAIFEIFEPNLKKIIKSAETNISFLKNIRKLLNLGKAVWNIIAPRLERVRNMLTELRAKREVEKLRQLAEPKPAEPIEVKSNIVRE
jgi:hypothetical protein